MLRSIRLLSRSCGANGKYLERDFQCAGHTSILAIFVVIHGTVAQWLERKPDKFEVDGSIPSRPTKKQMPQRITSQSSGLRECESHLRLHMPKSSSSLGHLKLIFSPFVVSLICRAIKALPSIFNIIKPGLLLSRLSFRVAPYACSHGRKL